MIIAWVLLLLSIAAVLVMALSTNAKLIRIAEIVFLCAFMPMCFALAGKTVHLG